MGPWDVVIILAVAALVGLAVFLLIRNRKKGKCTCGCDGCSGRANCHEHTNQK